MTQRRIDINARTFSVDALVDELIDRLDDDTAGRNVDLLDVDILALRLWLNWVPRQRRKIN